MKKIVIMVFLGFVLATVPIQGDNTNVKDDSVYQEEKAVEETTNSKLRTVGNTFTFPNSGGGRLQPKLSVEY